VRRTNRIGLHRRVDQDRLENEKEKLETDTTKKRRQTLKWDSSQHCFTCSSHTV
jgi:hypothetical protein